MNLASVRSAETIAVGTELLLGEIRDTNGAWLAAALAARGVDVYWSLRVGDNLDRIRDALETALARSQLVVTSGGLGPTEDDLTREAIAALLGETPAVDADLEAELRARFARHHRPMPERNLKQAWTVPSASPLANPRGTAPGWLVRTERAGEPRWIAALPGPPHELVRMAERELFPALPLPRARLWTRTLKTAGIGESEVASRLGALALAGNPTVATYARGDGVHVRVAAKGDDAASAAALGEPVAQEVGGRLGDTVWGTDGDTLEGVVAAALAARGLRLALIEDATGGALATRMTAVSPAWEGLAGAMVASAEAMDTMGASAAADPGTRAEQAAEHVLRFFAADVAIAVGEVLRVEADGGARVDLAVTGATGSHHHAVHLAETGTAFVRDRVVLGALDLLRRRLANG